MFLLPLGGDIAALRGDRRRVRSQRLGPYPALRRVAPAWFMPVERVLKSIYQCSASTERVTPGAGPNLPQHATRGLTP